MNFHTFFMLFTSCFGSCVTRVPPPCSNIFQYRQEGRTPIGLVKLHAPVTLGDTLVVQITIFVRAQLPSNYVGTFELAVSKEQIVEDLKLGRPVRYRVRFPIVSPLPRVMKIVVNGVQVCFGQFPTGPGATTRITMEHTLYTNNKDQLDDYQDKLEDQDTMDDNENYPSVLPPMTNVHLQNQFANTEQRWQSVRPNTQRPIPLRRPSDADYQIVNSFYPASPPPQVKVTTQAPSNRVRDVCGKRGLGVNTLMIGGKDAGHGDWPWLVALYMASGANIKFQCGGSLVSDNIVLTAAHCLFSPERKYKPIGSERMLILAGTADITNWSDGVTASVSRAVVHPDYRPTDGASDADIAVLVTKRNLEFSDTLRPLCLWNEPDDLHLVEGVKGSVVGWGSDGFVQLTSMPKVVKVPILTENECFHSHQDLRPLITSRTLCAGGRDGIGPCNGDSGGGLVMFRNNRWVLRGIVSKSLLDEHNRCNVHEVIIYTDVAKFIDWIESFIDDWQRY